MQNENVQYIRNVTLNWVSLKEEDKYGKFSLQIEFPKDRLPELGHHGNAKPLPNGNMAISLNTNPLHGKETKTPGVRKDIKIINMSNEEVTVAIGNGSTGDVKVVHRPSPKAFNGMKSYPLALCVRNLIEYVPTTDDFDIVELPETEAVASDNF